MSPVVLYAALRDRGVNLAAFGGRLRVDAPRGALTPDLRAAVAAHKTELLAMLSNAERTSTFDAVTGDPAAVLLRGTVIGDMWLVVDHDTLADHQDIIHSGLPTFFFDEVPHLARLDAEGLRSVAAVKRVFPTSRLLQ